MMTFDTDNMMYNWYWYDVQSKTTETIIIVKWYNILYTSEFFSPDSDDLCSLAWDWHFGLPEQTLDVCDGTHGGSDEPRQPEEGT